MANSTIPKPAVQPVTGGDQGQQLHSRILAIAGMVIILGIHLFWQKDEKEIIKESSWYLIINGILLVAGIILFIVNWMDTFETHDGWKTSVYAFVVVAAFIINGLWGATHQSDREQGLLKYVPPATDVPNPAASAVPDDSATSVIDSTR